MSPINADSRNDTCGQPPGLEHRKSTQALTEQIDRLTKIVDRLCNEREEDRQLLHLLLLLWGVDPKNPDSVARAYSSRLKVIDAGKVLLIFTSGGAAALILAAINWLPSLWKGMK